MFCKKCGGAVTDGKCSRCGEKMELSGRSRGMDDIPVQPPKKYRVVWLIGGVVWEEQWAEVGKSVAPMRPSPKQVGQSGIFRGWENEQPVMPDHDLVISAKVTERRTVPATQPAGDMPGGVRKGRRGLLLAAVAGILIVILLLAATIHIPTAYGEDKEATCTEAGSRAGTRCSICKKILTEPEEIPAMGHIVQAVPGRAETCEAAGLTEGSICSVCGETILVQAELPQADHTPEPFGEERAATCTEAGSRPGTKCSECGAVLEEVQEIPMMDHSYRPATCTQPRTCSICGAEEGQALPHTWVAATCTEAKYCSICGAREGAAHGHTWTEAICTKPATCRICGTTDGVPSGEHTYVKTGVSQIPVCSGCNQAKAVFLPELQYTYKWGKLWLRTEVAPGGSYDTKASAPGCWMNEDILGCTVGPVRDNKGNTFTWGLHLDSGINTNPGSVHPCSITYQLDGHYTSFTGVCAYPADVISTVWAPQFSQYLEIYCDGKLAFRSNLISRYSGCQTIPPINVTGIQELTISWPMIEGPNEVCTLYDAKLS